MLERTGNFFDVKNGRPYVWGKVEEIIEAGPYAIIAYQPWASKNGDVRVGQVDPNTLVMYHAYFYHAPSNAWRDTNTSHGTLEESLAHAMAVRWDGQNSQAASFFVRMIGVTEIWRK